MLCKGLLLYLVDTRARENWWKDGIEKVLHVEIMSSRT